MDSKENKAMNENINLIEILKDAPIGTKLWSPICGECKLIDVALRDYSILVSAEENNVPSFTFMSDGRYANYPNAECLLFPSKDNRDWSTFKAPWKHKHFQPFEKVLIANRRAFDPATWIVSFYSHYRYKEGIHYTLSGAVFSDDEIISYKGNEDKLGKLVK